MKIVIDKAESRGYANHGWLKTFHTFSFADYFNPQRMNFGMLRVLNDDTVAPGEGFGMHPHKNMEVISIPLKGILRHGDSIENSTAITPGDIQVMSTGSGIFHSEFNDSDSQMLEFLQIWVFPKEKETRPRYENYDIRPTQKKNTFSLIISPEGNAPASILQDAWFSMGTFDAGQHTTYQLHRTNTGVYAFVIEGRVEINEVSLSRRDGAGFWETETLSVNVKEDATLLLMEVPMQ